MASDNTKLQYIVELLTQGDTKKATDELKKLSDSGEKTSKSLSSATDSAKQLFAFLGGTALVTESINKFLEAERAVNALNAALEMTGNGTPEVIAQVRELAEVLGDELKKDADDVVKVMTQLITFGANPKDLRRLTESVFDLSEVMGRDVSRASRGMAQALRGNFEVFQQLGIEVDKTKSATDGFNEAYDRLVLMITGRAKRAVEGAAGDIEKLKVTLDDAKEKLGEWTTAILTATANAGANLGRLLSRPEIEKAITSQKEQYIALADAIAKAILEAEKLGKITKEQAGVMFGRLGGARELLRSGQTQFGQTTSDEELRRIQENVLPQAGGLLSSLQKSIGARGGIGTGAGQAQSGPGQIETPGLSIQDELAALEEKWRLEDAIVKSINEEHDSRLLVAKVVDEQIAEEIEAFQNGERIKQDLIDQRLLTTLEGEALVVEGMRQNHERRVEMINQEKFETEDQYNEALRLNEELYEAEKRRHTQAQTYSFKLKQDMQQVAESGMQAFSSGLAGAIVSAFEEGDKAFQKFAANFLRQIAEMILQALILRAIRGVFGMADGGQAVAMANGGMIYAANGVAGVSDVSSPTFFPKFNVLAGEAGREVMTVLARPKFERINGVPAQIGYAGGNRLAITSADSLARAGGGAGGNIVIEVRYSKDTEARVLENSVANARVAIVQDMAQDSQLSRVTRQKMA